MVLPVRMPTESMAAITSFEEVLPALPVTPITSPRHSPSAHIAVSCRARSVSGTVRTGPLCFSLDSFATAATAPLRSTSSTYRFPSLLGPRRAKNRSPGAMVRESMLQPVTRASLDTLNPSADATWLKLNSIAGVAQFAQHIPCHFSIVEMYDAILQYLVRFMAFAGQNHDVAGTRFGERGADRTGTIRLQRVRRVKTAQPHQSVVHDRQWIFGARIVRREHHKVAHFGSRLRHQRTLGAVAIPTAAKKRNHTFGVQLSRHRNHVAQGIVGVGIIHHNQEWLPLLYAFESAGHARRGSDGLRDGPPVQSVAQSRPARRQNVISVKLAHQR